MNRMTVGINDLNSQNLIDYRDQKLAFNSQSGTPLEGRGNHLPTEKTTSWISLCILQYLLDIFWPEDWRDYCYCCFRRKKSRKCIFAITRLAKKQKDRPEAFLG